MTDPRAIIREHALGLDHIAIAVPDLQASVAFYRDTLGFELLDQRETRGARTGMISAVMRLGASTVVLIQGTEPESQVSRFVEACGPGVQHIAIEVRNLGAVHDALVACGARFEMPMIEGPVTRQVFTMRDDAVGVRIELIERHGEGFDDRPVSELFNAMEARDAW